MSAINIELEPLQANDYNLPVYQFFLGWTDKTVHKQWNTVDDAIDTLVVLLHQYNNHCTAINKTEQINLMWETSYGWMQMLAVHYEDLNNNDLDVFAAKMISEARYPNSVETILLKVRAKTQVFFDSVWEYRNKNN